MSGSSWKTWWARLWGTAIVRPSSPDTTPANMRSEAGVRAMYRQLDVFVRAEAYRLRLERAQTLPGELRLQVMRNILTRMVRYDVAIQASISHMHDQLTAGVSSTEDPVLKGVYVQYTERLSSLKQLWQNSVAAPTQKHLEQLDTVLSDYFQDRI